MPAGAISHPANALDSTPLSRNFDQYHLTNPRGAISNVFSIIDFAGVGHRSADFQLVWELRTVNQRFLETTFRFLEALKGIEQSLRECARQALTRGELDASLKLEANRADHKFTVNEPLLEALQAGVTAIGLKAPRTAPLSQSQLLAWPGVLHQSETGVSDLAMAATTLFEQGLDELTASRAEEGTKLQDIVCRALGDVDTQIQRLETPAQTLPARRRQKLQDRVDELTIKVDAERLAQEVVLLGQKPTYDKNLIACAFM